MGSFGWLHLTDLHWGMTDQKSLWPRMKQKFLEDIPVLYEESGPWDLVLFTGDLTQGGTAEQFEQFDGVLLQCWQIIEECGSHPALLAVPGNHDLLRPVSRDPIVRVLKSWDRDVQSEFWSDANCPYRDTVVKAFTPYSEWWNAQTLRPATVRPGMLPGDFSASIEKNGVNLGIIGLNTTFLQLTDGDYKGRLSVDSLQFQDASGGDGPAWTKQHDACLLLTHQPPDWLTPQAQMYLNSEIADAGQFALHLFGHMHESLLKSTALGGGDARRILQGRSMFGLEYFAGKGGDVVRSHGYSAGNIELLGDKGTFTIWPRQARPDPDGTWRIVPDQSYVLVDYIHTKPLDFPLLRPLSGRKSTTGFRHDAVQSIRRDMLAAHSIRELRDALYQLEDLLGSLPKNDPRYREGQTLRDDLVSAMRRERALTDFRKQGKT